MDVRLQIEVAATHQAKAFAVGAAERGYATLSPEKQLALLDALKDSRDDESRIDGKAPAAAD